MSNFESGPVNLRDDGSALRFEDAAKRVSVDGWACIKCGRFYGDGNGAERAARYCCHTDAPCECGRRKTRHRVVCDECWHAQKIKTWDALTQEPWDEKAMLTTYDGDEYFADYESFMEWCADHNVKPSESFVIHCEEHGPPQINLSEAASDYLPEDHEFEYDAEARAIEALANEYLASKRPWSWYPDRKRRPTDAELSAWDSDYESAHAANGEVGG